MTCRCSSSAEHAQRAVDQATYASDTRAKSEAAAAQAAIDATNKRYAELAARSPNPDQYEIEEVAQVGANLVLRVKYPNCRSCAFEGSKVMVFWKTSPTDALKWKRIDPHFRSARAEEATINKVYREAPSPMARFPGSAEGWADALAYARGKS